MQGSAKGALPLAQAPRCLEIKDESRPEALIEGGREGEEGLRRAQARQVSRLGFRGGGGGGGRITFFGIGAVS